MGQSTAEAKKILIVDDDAELRANLSEVLVNAGFTVDTASSGREALRRLRALPTDLVLLDLMMPGMDGIETLAQITRARLKVKVVMLTAFATVQNAVEAIKRGASDYISKPFKIDELLSVVRRVIEEAGFEGAVESLQLDDTLSSLSNVLRRNIICLLHAKGPMRLMQLTRGLEESDHTKVVFHLRTLRESRIIEQGEDKAYRLSLEGESVLECLQIIRNHLTGID